jgi:competence ComEA-like helix-hairpin-helix protein
MTKIEKHLLLIIALLVSLGFCLEFFGYKKQEALVVQNSKKVYFVPSQSLSRSVSGQTDMSEKNIVSHESQDLPEKPSRKKASSTHVAKLQKGQKININTANLMELQRIKGVGEKMAQRILDYRKSNGPFTGASDLDKIKGIGDKKLNSMLLHITF